LTRRRRRSRRSTWYRIFRRSFYVSTPKNYWNICVQYCVCTLYKRWTMYIFWSPILKQILRQFLNRILRMCVQRPKVESHTEWELIPVDRSILPLMLQAAYLMFWLQIIFSSKFVFNIVSRQNFPSLDLLFS
jgi:hypothetical protein